jgi:2-polyprenyl-6-methoxyphenol hydroxylase-like FAD-dependent oxidoreductase
MAEDFGAVEMCRLAEYDEKGVETRRVDLTEQNKMWQHPWMLVHRVRLHDRLKLVATGEKGEGKPAELHLSSRVMEVNPETATLVLETGDRIQADVILGADGIYVSSYLESLRQILRMNIVQDEGAYYWTTNQALWLWKGRISFPDSTESSL